MRRRRAFVRLAAVGIALRRAWRLALALPRLPVAPRELAPILWRRYRDHGARGLIERFAYWSRALRLDAGEPTPLERLRELVELTPAERRRLARAGRVAGGPLFALLLNPARWSETALSRALAALRAQCYPRWELCVAVTPEDETRLRVALDAAGIAPRQVRWAPCPAPASVPDWGGMRAARRCARGDYLLLLDPSWTPRADALLLLAALASAAPDADLIYADESLRDAAGCVRGARLKPDWNHLWWLGWDYIGTCCAVRAPLFDIVFDPAFAAGSDGAAADGPRLEQRAGIAIWHLPYPLFERWPACLDAGTPLARRRRREQWRQTRSARLAASGDAARLTGMPLPRAGRLRPARPARWPLVSVLVPTRNGGALLRACIDSLFGITDYPALELLLIDNGSDDPDTLADLRDLAERPACQVLRAPGPFNYAALNNAAAAVARGDYLLLLNDDTEILTPGWLQDMVSWATRPGVGAVGAKLLYGDRSVQHAGIALGIMGGAGHAGRGQPLEAMGPGGQWLLAHQVGAVTGACLLVGSATYRMLGGLDARALPVAYNDVDFCLRLRATGRAIVWTPHALLLHHESKTRGADRDAARAARLATELGVLRRRWGRLLGFDPAWNPNWSATAEDGSLPWPARLARPAALLRRLCWHARHQPLRHPHQAPWWRPEGE